MWHTVAALRCVICLSSYNDSIICCCLGNRHICCATQSAATHRCFCAHVCTGELTVFDGSGTRVALYKWMLKHERRRVTKILHNETHWENDMLWKSMQASWGGTRRHVTCFQSIFSCKLRQTRFYFQKHTRLIFQKHKACLQQRRAPRFFRWDSGQV